MWDRDNMTIDYCTYEAYASKKIIVADLDGTLAVSKGPIDREMGGILCGLLGHMAIAVISGGEYKQFRLQLVGKLECGATKLAEKLYLFPTNATAFYRFVGGRWIEQYAERLTDPEKALITASIGKALSESGVGVPERSYGERIEDRGTQITFSALGQNAPYEVKSVWDPDAGKRLRIKAVLDRYLPDFQVSIGGTSSIDISRKGIDKAYGIRKIEEVLGYGVGDMLYIGDSLFEGGNDYAAKATGVDCVEVKGPDETKKVLGAIAMGVGAGEHQR